MVKHTTKRNILNDKSPSGEPGIIKFIADGEGLNGHLIAAHNNGKEGIVIVMNTPINGLFHWGDLVLVKVNKPKEWSKFVKVVTHVPDKKGWTIHP